MDFADDALRLILEDEHAKTAKSSKTDIIIFTILGDSKLLYIQLISFTLGSLPEFDVFEDFKRQEVGVDLDLIRHKSIVTCS